MYYKNQSIKNIFIVCNKKMEIKKKGQFIYN